MGADCDEIPCPTCSGVKKAREGAAPNSAESCKPSSPAPTPNPDESSSGLVVGWQRRAAERIAQALLGDSWGAVPTTRVIQAERIIREESANADSEAVALHERAVNQGIELERLRAELAEAIGLLRGAGDNTFHHRGCPISMGYGLDHCSCGLDDFYSKVSIFLTRLESRRGYQTARGG